MTFEEILPIEPYSMEHDDKYKLLNARLIELTKLHAKNCREYHDMLESISFDYKAQVSYLDIPFIPVREFKELKLLSVPEDEVVKIMTSSKTTGQQVSKIYLDRNTSTNQQKALVKIVSSFTGASRMPMIIIDCPSVIKDRKKFSARGAGILGFSIFGSKKIYALDDEMRLDVEGLKDFLKKYTGQRIFLFGFTFMIWQYFYKELVRLKSEGVTFDLSDAVMIHGGGWKKLINERVSREEFNERLRVVCGLKNIHDYYGMVEQTGCIYMECECGHLHASIFSDVIARRPRDFSICDIGEPGILQVVSTIPESYPGHSLLTEDEGIILGEDDCPCGRKGKYFKVLGRIAKAEIRGCSDTFDKGDKINSKESSLSIQADDLELNKSDIDINNINKIETSQKILKKVDILVGSKENICKIRTLPSRKPFDELIVEFLNTLSNELIKGEKSKAFPDVVTLGFWLRKSSILSMKKRLLSEDYIRLGLGVAFHIAPSNVPVNYAYSLFTGLICGNANIVRIPSKDFPQVRVINKTIEKVLEDDRFAVVRPYINLVRYDRNREINDYFSELCDVRIVWGGDRTIEELRRSNLTAKATEVLFADRYSLAVIDSNSYIEADNKDIIAHGFYNDTYLSDQNACTSPRVVVWTGSKVAQAKKDFWERLECLANKKYRFQDIYGVDKLSLLFKTAATYNGIKAVKRDNILYVVEVDRLEPELMKFRGNSGFLYEYDCKDILELRDFCNDTHCQTIGLLGDNKLIKPLFDLGIKGVDRVVPIGHTMDYDLIWDGINLVDRLSRVVKI